MPTPFGCGFSTSSLMITPPDPARSHPMGRTASRGDSSASNTSACARGRPGDPRPGAAFAGAQAWTLRRTAHSRQRTWVRQICCGDCSECRQALAPAGGDRRAPSPPRDESEGAGGPHWPGRESHQPHRERQVRRHRRSRPEARGDLQHHARVLAERPESRRPLCRTEQAPPTSEAGDRWRPTSGVKESVPNGIRSVVNSAPPAVAPSTR